MKRYQIALLITALVISVFFRLWHIEFGLPHSFHADEAELVEPAFKYAFELKSILREKEYYRLFPESFVYGTFPSYLNTTGIMFFSKLSKLVNYTYSKFDVYVFLRTTTALLSILLVVSTGFFAYILSKDKKAGIAAAFLAALNWKLIVHAHYVNADIIQAIFLNLSFMALYRYYKLMKDTKWTIITGVYFGIAVATKITTLLSLPLFFYVFLVKRDYKELAGFALTALGTFIIVNPFAFILNDKFMFRIFEMFTKEAGLVFDSLDSNPFKYLIALFYVATPLVSIFSLYGKYSVFKKGSVDNKEFHIFLVANVVLYILFFSLQSRRVDRWLLPILPIFISYAAIGLCTFYKKVQKKWVSIVLFTIVFGSYIHFPLLLLQQFQPNTPKSASYLWLKDKVVKGELVLAYTEQGLDPLHKIQYSRVEKIGVYENEAAQLDFPRDPNNYKYVVISSRPMEYHKNPKIIEKYPLYASKWAEFENELLNPSKFILIKEFTLPKPNLIPLSDVFVYEKVM